MTRRPWAPCHSLPCAAPDETADFWQALGFTKTYDVRRPYLHLASRWRGMEVPYGAPPRPGLNPAAEDGGGRLAREDLALLMDDAEGAIRLRAERGALP